MPVSCHLGRPFIVDEALSIHVTIHNKKIKPQPQILEKSSTVTTPLIEKGEKPIGAGNEIRTRDSKLGKLALYQLSYARKIGFPSYDKTELLSIYLMIDEKGMG